MAKEEFDKLVAKVNDSETVIADVKAIFKQIVDGLDHETSVIPMLIPWALEVNGTMSVSSVALTWFRPSNSTHPDRELSFYLRGDGKVDCYCYEGNDKAHYRCKATDTYRLRKYQHWFEGTKPVPEWFHAMDLGQWFDDVPRKTKDAAQ